MQNDEARNGMASAHEKIAAINLEQRETYIKFRRGYRKYLIWIIEAPVCQGNPLNTFFVACSHFGWCDAPPAGFGYNRDRFARFSDRADIIHACTSYVEYTERLAVEAKQEYERAVVACSE